MYHWICVQFAHTCISSRIIPLATPLLYAAQSSLYGEKRPFNWRIILLEINLREWFHSNVQSIHAHDAKLHAWLMHVHYNPSASINPAAKKKLLLLVSLSCCWWTLYRSAHTTGSWARGERGNLILALAPFLSRLFTCGWLLCSVRRELRDKGKELLICWCASLRHRLRCILTKLMRNTTHNQPHWWDARSTWPLLRGAQDYGDY